MQPTPNSHHDPDWKTTHDRHAAARERAMTEMRRLAETDAWGAESYRRAKAEFDFHQAACIAAMRSQHATVADYGRWLFQGFPAECGTGAEVIPFPTVDFSALRTMEDADDAYARTSRFVSDAADERRAALPTGQPPGLLAFADPASPALTRTWREFSPADLHPGGAPWGSGARAIVVAEACDDGLHVCFGHVWDAPGPSVPNAIEELATAVHREATGTTAASAGGGVLARLLRAVVRAPAGASGWFHVYQHVPPRAGGLRESFDRVELDWEGGRFRNARWIGYPTVPKLIGDARHDLATGVPSTAATPVPPPLSAA